jgi:hypothetical protein
VWKKYKRFFTLTNGVSTRRCEATVEDDFSNPLYISFEAQLAIASFIRYCVVNLVARTPSCKVEALSKRETPRPPSKAFLDRITGASWH